MKSIILRAIASMIVGGLLMAYPEKITDWLVILTGCLFLVPGVYSLVSYWTLKKQEGMQIVFPIAGLGSTLLGIWMILDSTFFIKAFMAAVALMLIIVAVNRIVNNVRARKLEIQVPFLFYVFPVLLILVSCYVLANPLEVAGIPIYILGISMIVYGLLEIWNTLWLHDKIKITGQPKETHLDHVEEIEDAEIVE